MNRSLSWGLASVAFLVLTGAPASAQTSPYARPGQFGPYGQPPISPYLNLLGNNNPAVNYYLQVLPQLNRPIIEGQLESQIRNLQRTTPELVSGELESLLRALQISEPLEATGHAVRFGELNPYFNTRRGPAQQAPAYRPSTGR